MKVGDEVKFIKLLSDSHEDWCMSAMSFNYVRSLIDKIGKIMHAQIHYEDDGTKSLYIDVKFPCDYTLKSANAEAFELIEN